MHQLTNGEAVEVEVAFARMAPGTFTETAFKAEAQTPNSSWRRVSRRAQGLAAINEVIVGAASGSAGDRALKDAQAELLDMLRRPQTPALAIPRCPASLCGVTNQPDINEIVQEHSWPERM